MKRALKIKYTADEFRAEFGTLPAEVSACEVKVMRKGYDQSSAIAICRSALGMKSDDAPGTPPADIHNRGKKPGDTKEIFDAPATTPTASGSGIHTPSFIKVQKKPKQNFELDPLWKQTRDVMGVEIFEAGVWKGREFTEKDLQDAVQNFTNGVLGTQPYITIDHDPKATDEFSKALDGMALGFVKNLYKAGKKLFADFEKVPRIIAELLKAGPLKNKSIELWPEYEGTDRAIYNNVLEAVTLTGKVPAVANLSDFVSLFKRETGVNQANGRRKISYRTGESKMDEITISMSEYTGLLKLKAEHDAQSDQLLKFKARTDEAAVVAANQEKKIAELEKFKADTAKANEVRSHEEAVAFVDAQIKAGKFLPKYKDFQIEQYKAARSKGPELFKLFTDEINDRKPVVITGEFKTGDGKTENFSAMNKKAMREEASRIILEFKKAGGTGSGAFDAAQKLMKSYMEKFNVSHDVAMKHLGLLKKPMEAEAEAREKMEAEAEKRSAKDGDGEGDAAPDDKDDKDDKDGKDNEEE